VPRVLLSITYLLLHLLILIASSEIASLSDSLLHRYPVSKCREIPSLASVWRYNVPMLGWYITGQCSYWGRSIWPQWPMGLVKHSFAHVTGTRVTVTSYDLALSHSARPVEVKGDAMQWAGWPRARSVFKRLFQSAAWRRSFTRHTGAILREKRRRKVTNGIAGGGALPFTGAQPWLKSSGGPRFGSQHRGWVLGAGGGRPSLCECTPEIFWKPRC